MDTRSCIDNDVTLVGKAEYIKPILSFFDKNGGKILEVTEKGLSYKGNFIEDAGEAYRAFIDACNRCGM